MATYYADTSVLVKQHVDEIGSGWVRTTLDAAAGHHIAVSRLAEVELVAAFARRAREGTLLGESLARAEDDAQRLGAQVYSWIELSSEVVERAQLLVRSYTLRTLDALHLASALLVAEQFSAAVLPALTFLAADERLLAAAQAEGMATDNPNLHP
jgi:predicted nucleic acid-binding protein